MKIAVIPARGGSKRIPRKNIRPFHGKPAIVWSIEAAIDSGCFDYILVSTDDDEIAEVARQGGAKVPFKRPESLSDDYIATAPVVAHAVDWVAENVGEVDLVCCIYATAPFVRPEDITGGLYQMEHHTIDFCFSAASFPFPIQRAIKVREDGRCEMFEPEMFSQRSQDLEEAYHDAGQFYWGTTDAWQEERMIFSEKSMPYIIPRYRVQDIDTPEDWERAELMMEVLEHSNASGYQG